MIYTTENKNKYFKNDIFNMQIISVKVLLFRIIINKGTVHNIVVSKERHYPIITKTDPSITKTDYTHHNKDGFNYPIILNALNNLNYFLDTIYLK